MKYLFNFIILLLLLSGSIHSTEENRNQLPKIIAFLGPKRVGKDTSADFLANKYGYQKYALADPMKKAVQLLFNFSNEQLWGDEKEILDPVWQVTPREIMQFIGIDVLFNELGDRFPHLSKVDGKTFYIRSFETCLKNSPNNLFVISDLRMQEDVTALKKMGAVIIRLERSGVNATDSHISEEGVNSVTGYEYTIINDGTIEELEEKINQVFKMIFQDQLIKLHNESYSSISEYYASITDIMREIRKDILSAVLNGNDHQVISTGPQSIRRQVLVPLPKSSRILDVGCALGDNLALMSEEGFERLTGIDIAHGMIDKAQERLTASWICGDVMQYYPSEGYDLVFAQALIHLFPKTMVKDILLHLLSLSNQRFYFSTTLHEIGSEGMEAKGDVMRYRSRYTLSEILALTRELLAVDPNLSFHYFILKDPLDKLWINGIFERRDSFGIYETDGVLLYKQFACPDAILDVLPEIDSFRTNAASPKTYLRYDAENVFDRAENILPFCSREVHDIIQNERVDQIINILLSEEGVLLKDKINYKMPGMGAFVPHQDAAAGWDRYGDKHLTFCLSFDYSTKENGALFFSCGDHTRGLLSPPKTPLDDAVVNNLEWIQVLTSPGDAIFFDSYTPHYSESNMSNQERKMAFLTYHARKFGDNIHAFFEDKRKRQPPLDERPADAKLVRDSFGKLIYK
ncbi:MAG: phytanoyl-CoA dioxygenase family protein [Parachlamydiaceae bacterium]